MKNVRNDSRGRRAKVIEMLQKDEEPVFELAFARIQKVKLIEFVLAS